MTRTKLGIAIAFFVAASALLVDRLFGGEQLEHAPAELAFELPFELIGGHIHVAGEMNGHAIDVMLDTGAGASLVDSALVDAWKLPTSGDLNVKGTGGAVTGKTLDGAKLTFGGLEAPIRFAIPLGNLGEQSGHPMQAIVGFEFFASHVVEIDYARRRLRIGDADAAFEPIGAAIPVRIVEHHPHIDVHLVAGGVDFAMDTMIDTGAGSSTITARFGKQHELAIAKGPAQVLASGVGGDVLGRLVRPEAIRIASFELAKPVLQLVEQEAGVQGMDADYDLSIGGDVLRRFKATFDYPHRRMFLAANDELEKPFECDKTGLRWLARGADFRRFEVLGVIDGSSAASAGVKPGDVLESIDGEPASKRTLDELRELFRSPTTKQWKLGLSRNGAHVELAVAAKTLI